VTEAEFFVQLLAFGTDTFVRMSTQSGDYHIFNDTTRAFVRTAQRQRLLPTGSKCGWSR